MKPSRIIGLVLMAVGIALVFFGYRSSQSLVNQFSESITGRFTDETMYYLVGGGAAILAGGLLALAGKK